MLQDDPLTALFALAVLAVAALVIDQIPRRPVDWSSRAASQEDVAKIVAGKQRESNRDLLKLALLLAVVLVLWWSLT